jgi:hypothetical protein
LCKTRIASAGAVALGGGDPAAVDGTDDAKREAFGKAFTELARYIDGFLARQAQQ